MVNNDFRDTVTNLLEAVANKSQEQLMQVLSDKMGDDFIQVNEALATKLFHVEKTQGHKPDKQPEAERP